MRVRLPHPRSFRVLTALALLVLAVLALPASPADAAKHHHRKAKERVINWSGYRWTVRTEKHRANPGNNRWSDSKANVALTKSGRLRLNIVKGRAAEVVGPRTTYGRYTWVVDSDLSLADPFRVAAFFVRGSGAEQDIEFSRWGEPFAEAAASWVSWRNPKTRLGWGAFLVSPLTPYTVEIDWRPAVTRYSVRDSAGTVLLDTTFPSAPARSRVSPRVSYWLYPGHGTHVNPYTSATLHPPLLLRSFRFSPN